MPINKFTTLLDLARQAKIISGETATFDGKIQAGIPFSGYPTGVDTGTTVSLGIVSSEDAVFSGNTGTTIFDVSNTGSTNYSPIFSGYTASTWTNPLFSGNTSGLTLPITPLSADTQIVGPFWTLTQTGMTGDYVIGTQYTGYSVTYSFFNVSQFGTGFTYSGFTTASQENFSAGTLDYKGPLDYISTKEDASVEGRLTTNKLTVTNGASASTIGYVLTQTGENGEAEWVINASAGTNTYVTGGTLTAPSVGSNLILGWNTGGSANPIDLSSLEFTGNTSGDCITDLYVRRLYGCSPITVHDTITYNGSIIDSATTNSFIFGSNHVLTASSLTHGVNADANVILGGNDNRITPNSTGFYNTIIGGEGNEINSRINYASIIGATNSNISSSTLSPTTIIGGNSNTITVSKSSVIIGGEGNFIGYSDRTIILGGSGITGTTDDTVYVPTLNINTIGSGTPVNNLGYDSSGNVVTGGTVNLSRRTTTQDAAADPDVVNVEVVFYSASSPGGTIYLNSAMNVAGKEVILIRTSTTNSANIGGSGGALINGSATRPLPTTIYSKVNCISDGTNWFCSRQTVI